MNKKLFCPRIPADLDRRKRRFSLFGNFGTGNLGNEATLQVVLYHLRRLAPDAEVTCICTGPQAVEAAYNVAALPIRRVVAMPWTLRNPAARLAQKLFMALPCELYRWLKCLMMLWGTDALIIPGTGLLTDAYGLVHWGPYSVFQWSLLAKLSGCKLLFVSVGAGPLYGRLGKFFVKSALALADFRSYRDTPSRQYLEKTGFSRCNDRVSPDLVFSLPNDVIPHEAVKSKRAVVGLGLMGCAGRLTVEKPDPSTYQNYLESLVILVGWLVTHDYDIRLLIGDVGDADLPQRFRRLVDERLPAYDPGRITDEPALSVGQLLSQLAATDLVVATRFHNVLLALLLDKPVMSISFHHKCASLMSQMGLSEYCQDINHLKPERLIEQFCQLQQNSGCVKEMIREKVAACRDALEEQYAIIFSDICPERQQAAPPGAEIQHHAGRSVPS